MFHGSISFIMRLFLGLIAISSANSQETGLEQSATPPEPFRIVGFGDSLMAGYRLDADQSFTAQLEKALRDKGYNIVIANAGVSGDTTVGGRERIDWSVPENTGLAILELGANDMLRGISPDITKDNLDFMLSRLQQRQIPVIVAGILSAPNLGQQNADLFNPIFSQLSEKYKATLYPFFLDGVAGKRTFLLDDGMHPNEKGIAVMVKKFLPTIEAKLEELHVYPEK